MNSGCLCVFMSDAHFGLESLLSVTFLYSTNILFQAFKECVSGFSLCTPSNRNAVGQWEEEDVIYLFPSHFYFSKYAILALRLSITVYFQIILSFYSEDALYSFFITECGNGPAQPHPINTYAV